MPKCTLLLLQWMVGSWLVAAGVTANAQHKSNFACHYFGQKINPAELCEGVHGYTTPRQLEVEIDRMLRYVGLGGYQKQFFLQECPNTDNCFATILDGKSYIFYDRAFLKEVIRNTNTQGKNWGALSILAHEIGHHVKSHVIDGEGSRPLKELEADRFSGFVLHQMGASLPEAQAAIQKYQSEQGTSTHPARAYRLKAIAEGWQEAENLYPLFGQNKSIKPTPEPSAESSSTEPEASEEASPTPPKPQPAEPTTPRETIIRGCVTGNCTNGIGKFVHETQGYYVGTWKNGKRHGRGIHYDYNDVKKYEGEWQLGKKQGFGRQYFDNGDWYEGEFYQDKIKGRGTMHYANGDVFSGEFEENLYLGGTYYRKKP
jgi:hypothetical protein